MSGGAIETPTATAESRGLRYRQLAAKLRQWMSEDDDYDQRVWPVVEHAVSSDGIQLRDPDAPDS